MLTKDEIETAVKNGMVYHRFNQKPTEPVLTRKIYDLMMLAYHFGYDHGVKAGETDFNEFQLGIVEMWNDYFRQNDNRQK